MADFGDVLRARILARAFRVGELPEKGQIHAQCRKAGAVKEIDCVFQLDSQLMELISHA